MKLGGRRGDRMVRRREAAMLLFQEVEPSRSS